MRFGPPPQSEAEYKRDADAWVDRVIKGIEKMSTAIVVLKPCPFCGVTPTLDEIPPHTHGPLARFMPDHPGSWVIECHGKDCGCGLLRGNRDEAIAAWNRRVPPLDLTSEAVSAALTRIAGCERTDEMDEDTRIHADYEFAYNMMIDDARAALAAARGAREGRDG